MLKRLFDLVLASFGIILISPILLILTLLIKTDSKGPIFFIHKRVGLHGKEFGVYKFRTMVVDAESKGLKITVGNDPRVTRIGHFLRNYKLDELAQLFNVLNGTMSFVGPRPEVKEFISYYPPEIRDEVLSVRPGITDLASIEMKDENLLLAEYDDPRRAYIKVILPIKQQFYIDYVRNHSLFLDVYIIFITVKKIFF